MLAVFGNLDQFIWSCPWVGMLSHWPSHLISVTQTRGCKRIHSASWKEWQKFSGGFALFLWWLPCMSLHCFYMMVFWLLQQWGWWYQWCHFHGRRQLDGMQSNSFGLFVFLSLFSCKYLRSLQYYDWSIYIFCILILDAFILQQFICCLSCVIVRARVVFRKTVVGDWCFDYLSGSHLQSQVKSRRQMMVFMPLVVVWIGQFCRDVIGRQNMKVAVTGQSLFCCYFRSVYCLLRYGGFLWGHVWVVWKVKRLATCPNKQVNKHAVLYLTWGQCQHICKGQIMIRDVVGIRNGWGFL